MADSHIPGSLNWSSDGAARKKRIVGSDFCAKQEPSVLAFSHQTKIYFLLAAVPVEAASNVPVRIPLNSLQQFWLNYSAGSSCFI